MRDIRQLAGKCAVVTGGASGIGRAIADRLVGLGMNVIIADVEQGALEQTAAEVGAVGILTDVTSFESVQALADEARRRFGAVHIFCSNAGVGSFGKVADMTLSDWSWILNVNLWGAIHGIKAFRPLLEANPDGGHLIVTASEVGFRVAAGLAGYTVSKFAVVALAETLALELKEAGSKVAVTLLCPGPVRTRLGSSQRNRLGAGGALVDSDLAATEAGQSLRWVEPKVVSEAMVRALEQGDLYAFTHPEMARLVLDRHRDIAKALADVYNSMQGGS